MMGEKRVVYNVLDFGAIGDGATDDAPAFKRSIEACAKVEASTLVVPSGYVFLASPFELCSNLELRVESGATLLAHPDESLYRESAFRENRKEGSIWIGGKHLNHLLLSGGGTIDGNGVAFMGEELPESYELKAFSDVDPRPHVLVFEDCRNIELTGITLQNAAYWGLHFIGCEHIHVHHVNVLNDLKIRNGDGIDFNHCRHAIVEDCNIQSGDDCICFKNRREYAEYGPCSDIVVRNCRFVSTSCSIKIGSENMDEISNILIEDCLIEHSNRGIGIQNRDEGTVSDITIRNIRVEGRLFGDVWWGEAEPIYVTAYPRPAIPTKDGILRFQKGMDHGVVGGIKNVKFENISCRSENGVFIGASDSNLIQKVEMLGVSVEILQITIRKGECYDLRPCLEASFLEDGIYGFCLHRVEDVVFKECSVSVLPSVCRNFKGDFGRLGF